MADAHAARARARKGDESGHLYGDGEEGAPVSDFRVVKRLQSDGGVIVEPDGYLDLGAARLLASVLAHSVSRAHPRETVVEAHNLRAADEAAVRFLSVAWPRTVDGRPLCRVARETEAVRAIFERSGAADLFADLVADGAPSGRRPTASTPGAKAV